MKTWLIDPSFESELRRLLSHSPTAEQLAGPVSAAESLDIVDGVASIPIRGFLTSERSRLMDIFGIVHTTYADIEAQVLQAEADDGVRKIEFQVESGGGLAGNALVNAADTIFAARKPTTAVVGDLAASAAYWLASQADEVLLAGQASSVGSIGVAVNVRVNESVVSIASTDAPRKRPDATTDQGKQDIRRGLDPIHKLFVDAVARGRGVSAETVNSDFGMGGTLLAADAVSAGMADRVIRPGAGAAQHGTIAAMDLETLRQSHPELYAECVGIGISKERSRASAHLTLAEASGEMSASVGHITSGLPVADDAVQASHLAAAIKIARQSNAINESAPELNASAPPTPDDGVDASVLETLALAGLKGSV